MDFLTSTFVRMGEWKKGQTMTEYALILAAIAVVVFVAYQATGTDINSLVNSVDSQI